MKAKKLKKKLRKTTSVKFPADEFDHWKEQLREQSLTFSGEIRRYFNKRFPRNK